MIQTKPILFPHAQRVPTESLLSKILQSPVNQLLHFQSLTSANSDASFYTSFLGSNRRTRSLSAYRHTQCMCIFYVPPPHKQTNKHANANTRSLTNAMHLYNSLLKWNFIIHIHLAINFRILSHCCALCGIDCVGRCERRWRRMGVWLGKDRGYAMHVEPIPSRIFDAIEYSLYLR